MSELLVVIKQQADLYERWTIAAADPDRALEPAEMAVYRMQAAGIELLKPILIWLHDPELAIPAERRRPRSSPPPRAGSCDASCCA